MEIRRSGNFGIIDTGSDKGLISFSIGGRGKGWEPSSIQLNRRGAFFSRKISVNGTFIVPMGDNNDMPGEVMRLLDKFYAGEGIMGKIAGLLGCSREMVSHSLAFRKNSKLARSIRKLAIERGGTKVGGNPQKKDGDEK